MSIRAQPLVSHLHHVLLNPITHLWPNHVCLSATTHLPLPLGPFEPGHLPPTQPCQFECNRSRVPPSPCPVKPDRSSPAQLCPFEHYCLSPTSTRPFWAQPLDSHPTMSICVPPLVSCLYHVLPSLTAHLPPRPSQFRCECEHQRLFPGPRTGR